MRLSSVLVLALTATAAAQSLSPADKPDFILDAAARAGIALSDAPPDSRYGIVPPQPLPKVADRGGPVAALSIALKRPEFPSFVWNEEFVYELVLKNVGALPIGVPWSPNIDLVRAAIYQDSPDIQRASISIVVYSPNGQLLGALETQHLAGAASELQTLQTLAPGQTAILKIRGRWRAPSADDAIKILSHPDHEVTLVATVILYNEGLVSRSDPVGPTMILPLSR